MPEGIRYGHAAMLGMTEHYWAQRMVPGPPNGRSQQRSRGGVQVVESGLGSRRARRGTNSRRRQQAVGQLGFADDSPTRVMGMEEGKSLESVAADRRAGRQGKSSEARVGCRMGAFLCRVRDERT